MLSVKLQLVLFSVLVFLIVSNPMTYKLTTMVTSNIGFVTIQGEAPTKMGIFLHALVFGLLMYGYLLTFKV